MEFKDLIKGDIKMFYFADDKKITVYFTNGNIAEFTKDNEQFYEILEMCRNHNWFKIACLHNPVTALMNDDNQVILTNKNLKIIDSENNVTNISLKTNNKVINFIKLLRDNGTIDTEIERIKPFIENMFKNKYIDCVTEIYDFCKHLDFAITDDGCFFAYKKVNNDFTSIHDGTTMHKIGTIVSVDEFDTDRDNTCSKGLHFYTSDYGDQLWGDTDIYKTIMVKINPKDVVAIPRDYDGKKGRCAKYEVVGCLANKNEDVKTSKISKTFNVVKPETRIEQTIRLLKKYKNNYTKVAEEMNISISTVKRNVNKHKNINR